MRNLERRRGDHGGSGGEPCRPRRSGARTVRAPGRPAALPGRLAAHALSPRSGRARAVAAARALPAGPVRKQRVGELGRLHAGAFAIRLGRFRRRAAGRVGRRAGGHARLLQRAHLRSAPRRTRDLLPRRVDPQRPQPPAGPGAVRPALSPGLLTLCVRARRRAVRGPRPGPRAGREGPGGRGGSLPRRVGAAPALHAVRGGHARRVPARTLHGLHAPGRLGAWRRCFRIWHRPWPQARAGVRIEDDALLRGFEWWRPGAQELSAHVTPGVDGVWIGPPRRVPGDG